MIEPPIPLWPHLLLLTPPAIWSPQTLKHFMHAPASGSWAPLWLFSVKLFPQVRYSLGFMPHHLQIFSRSHLTKYFLKNKFKSILSICLILFSPSILSSSYIICVYCLPPTRMQALWGYRIMSILGIAAFQWLEENRFGKCLEWMDALLG